MTKTMLLLALTCACSTTWWSMESGPGVAKDIREQLGDDDRVLDAGLLANRDFFHVYAGLDGELKAVREAVAAIDPPEPEAVDVRDLQVGIRFGPTVLKVEWPRRMLAFRYPRSTVRIVEVASDAYEIWWASAASDSHRVYVISGAKEVSAALARLEAAARRSAKAGVRSGGRPFPLDVTTARSGFGWMKGKG